jgi:pimeloyl-ACP methyl ester carboxylesterase
MRGFKDISDKSIRKITAPTLIVQGDQDNVRPEHSIALTKMIKGSRLLILPGGHGDFLGDISMSQAETQMPTLTTGLINEFLGAP